MLSFDDLQLELAQLSFEEIGVTCERFQISGVTLVFEPWFLAIRSVFFAACLRVLSCVPVSESARASLVGL